MEFYPKGKYYRICAPTALTCGKFADKTTAMSRISWNQELSVGVKEIDDQHKELIGIANTLLEAVDNGNGPAVAEKIIKRLRDYTVHHFSSEEALMRKERYPNLSEHMARHGRLKQDVKQFQRLIYERKSPAPAMVMTFLRDWLLDHILTYDREFARFLNEKPKEETWAVVGKK